MRPRCRHFGMAPMALATALAACSDNSPLAVPGDGGMDAPAVDTGTRPPPDLGPDLGPGVDVAPVCTGRPLDAVLLEQCVFTPHCAVQGCHQSNGTDGPTGRMNLESGHARASLVRVMAMGPQCGGTGFIRVVPGDVDASLIVHKLSEPMPPCGARMPLGMHPIDPALIQLVRDWIAAGAP